LDTAKTSRADEKAAAEAIKAAEDAYTQLGTDITNKQSEKDGFDTQITGLTSDIAAQQAIIDAGNEGETAYDNAVTEKATLEGLLSTKEGLRDTAAGELATFKGQKDDLDKATAGATADFKLKAFEGAKSRRDAAATLLTAT
jgi:predicted  nucleic acid-binding Zn-ribbon protein